MQISSSIVYTGVYDRELELFEGQYPVPQGVTYNSYAILDDKIALMDSVDARKTQEWLNNVEAVLGGRQPDYLVVHHLEPDHGGSLMAAAEKYPRMQLVMSAKAQSMLPQFGYEALVGRTTAVKENDTLALGRHTLRFFMAPMVHWPEVMVSFEESEGALFSADAFGTFGDPEKKEWLPEARRYYFNIVGKYGAQAQGLLKKAAGLNIGMILPLHGPALTENVPFYVEKYGVWSSYAPEEKGVFVAYGTLHGNTGKAARQFADALRAAGEQVVALDLMKTDLSEALAQAFRFDRVVLAAPTYDGALFPRMEDFIHHLKAKAFQQRRVGIMENGSWGPMAAKRMKALLEDSKEIALCDTTVTIKTTLNEDSQNQMDALAQELLG